VLVLTDAAPQSPRPTAVALGVFDGAHRGHQDLIARLVTLAAAHDAQPTIITFSPDPARVLAPLTAPGVIATLEQRLEWFGELGVTQVRVLSFDEESANESADDFIARVVVGELGAVAVLAGDDTHFGRDRSGGVASLMAAADHFGFVVEQCPSFGGDTRVSSSLVRAALRAGECETASALLGRPFVLRGTVVHGDHRGREIGFPTANLLTADDQVLPSLGIYAGAAHVQGAWRAAAISVGKRPHFYDDGALLVEVHLPQFQGDLYGTSMDVAFLHRLRGEAAFASLEELLEQIGRDVAESQGIFEKFTPESSRLLR